jgi:murein DD-endopeptidase MepM/ murein hydrolase activator NlpD
MARRGFFWFSAKWLHYKVWPTWIWHMAKGLLILLIALFAAWALALAYFYFFPSPSIAQIRTEIQSKTDSLTDLQKKLLLLKQEESRVHALDSLLYAELTSIPPRKGDSVGASQPMAEWSVLQVDTLTRYVERIRELLARQMQQEALLQRLVQQIRYLPRYRPVEKGEIAVGFGPVYHPITMQIYEHRGVDFIVAAGTPVLVTADGLVREVSPLPFGENSYKVLVEHMPSLHTLYYPLDPTVHPGQLLAQGTRIGYVTRLSMARTTFLHYEVWRQGGAIDPLPYLWGDLAPQEIQELQEAFQSPGHGLH